MKFWPALNVFFHLLGSRQWFILIEHEKRHICDCQINIVQVRDYVAREIDSLVQQETLLNEAKEILTKNINN